MAARLGSAVVQFRFTSWAAGLATGTQDVPADMAEKQPLKGIAQLPNGRGQWQPFDRHDVLHEVKPILRSA